MSGMAQYEAQLNGDAVYHQTGRAGMFMMMVNGAARRLS